MEACLQTRQRNIAAKRLAQGSIKSAQHRRQADNFGTPTCSTYANRASLKLAPAELAPTEGTAVLGEPVPEEALEGKLAASELGATMRLAAFSSTLVWLALPEIAYLTSTNQYLDLHDI